MRKILLLMIISIFSFTACKKKEVTEEIFEITAKTSVVINNSQLTTIRIKGKKDLPNTLHETYQILSTSSKLIPVAYEFKSQTEFELNVTTDANLEKFHLSFNNSSGKTLNVMINKTNDWVTREVK